MKIYKVITQTHGESTGWPQVEVKYFTDKGDAEDFVLEYMFYRVPQAGDSVSVEHIDTVGG